MGRNPESNSLNEIVTAEINVVHPTSTEDVISKYEQKIISSIAIKSLNATNLNLIPQFTQEELAYLNKVKQESFSLDSEVKVITPAPTITLKKGNTEINIKNATTLVQKMEEKYPTVAKYDTNKQVLTTSFGQFTPECVDAMTDTIREQSDYKPQLRKPIESLESKTQGKNAYEIRADVLAMAVDWVKFTNQIVSSLISDDIVLSTAQKFYKFVENKRN